jgi:hypothetical protein
MYMTPILKLLSNDLYAGSIPCSNNPCWETGGPPVFLFEFKGTPSQEEHKTIFSGLAICKMTLSDQSDFPAIFRLRKMTYPNFTNFGI